MSCITLLKKNTRVLESKIEKPCLLFINNGYNKLLVQWFFFFFRVNYFDTLWQAMDPPSVPEEQVLLPSASEADNADALPSLNLSLKSEFEPMEATSKEKLKEPEESVTGSIGLAPILPGLIPAYLPSPFLFWPPNTFPMEEEKGAEPSHHQVLKPIPILPKEPVNVDELVGMSQLSLEEAERRHREPSPLSLKLIGEPSRQSAFHANAPVSGSDLNKQGESSVIQAVWNREKRAELISFFLFLILYNYNFAKASRFIFLLEWRISGLYNIG
jgi:hypothetical protein